MIGELLHLLGPTLRTQVVRAPLRREHWIQPVIVSSQQDLVRADALGSGALRERERIREAGVVEQIAAVEILDVDQRLVVVDHAAQQPLALAQ